MSRLNFGRAAFLAAAICAAGATAASAATVSYYTTGTFLSTGTNQALIGGPPNYSITFGGVGSIVLPASVDAPTNTSFGTFTTAATSTTAATFTDQFTLNIFQVVPATGTGTLIGSLAGELAVNMSDLTLTFSTFSTNIVAGGFTTNYRVVPVTFLAPPSTNFGETTLQGQIGAPSGGPNPVPLPSAALGGIALLGGIGALKGRRATKSTI